MSGASSRIYYVSSCHPGCRHDTAVFKDTPLFRHLMSGWRPFEDGIILGDAGYPVSIKCNKLFSIFEQLVFLVLQVAVMLIGTLSQL